MKIAQLKAQEADFQGVAETLRRAEETLPEVGNDWRLSTVLALEEIAKTNTGWIDQLGRRLDQRHPEVSALVEGMCAAYWPRFAQLCDLAKDRWKGAILQGYYFAAQEKSASDSLQESAVRCFALAVQ